MASSASGQDDSNRALWLATRAGKIEPSCSLGTTCCIPQAKFLRKPYNKSFIDQVCSVKMAGYWPRSFFASFKKRTWPISSHLDLTLGQQPIHIRGGPFDFWGRCGWFSTDMIVSTIRGTRNVFLGARARVYTWYFFLVQLTCLNFSLQRSYAWIFWVQLCLQDSGPPLMKIESLSTATRRPLGKRFNEENNSHARAL